MAVHERRRLPKRRRVRRFRRRARGRVDLSLQRFLAGCAPQLPEAELAGCADRKEARQRSGGTLDSGAQRIADASRQRRLWNNALMRYVVLVAFVLIIASLASALVFIMKDRGTTDRAVKALALRVGFSITLFLMILVAYKLGWIQPTGIR
jgi:hypothetical protein